MIRPTDPTPALLILIALAFTLTHSTASTNYTFLDLVRQWPPNACYRAAHTCKHFVPTINTWTIHGLWPTLNATSYPSDCGDCDFDSSLIADLADQLHVKWPSDYKGGDTKFWDHEFCKHGTCSRDIMPTEHTYFAKALALHAQFKMESALDAVDIKPSITKTYTMAQLGYGLKSEFGLGRATYWCRWVKDGGVTKQLLYQVSICLDKKFQIQDCPEGREHSCNAEVPIYFIPYHVLDGGDSSDTHAISGGRGLLVVGFSPVFCFVIMIASLLRLIQ